MSCPSVSAGQETQGVAQLSPDSKQDPRWRGSLWPPTPPRPSAGVTSEVERPQGEGSLDTIPIAQRTLTMPTHKPQRSTPQGESQGPSDHWEAGPGESHGAACLAEQGL